jgi:hypothetical protein
VATPTEPSDSDLAVCRQCTALVLDPATHERAVHPSTALTR